MMPKGGKHAHNLHIVYGTNVLHVGGIYCRLLMYIIFPSRLDGMFLMTSMSQTSECAWMY